MTGYWAGAEGGAYHAWADALGRWARAEDVDLRTLPALQPAELPDDAWQRLTVRLTEALSTRLQRWADGLVRGLAEAGGDELAVGRALTHGRAGLRTVRELAHHPGLPDDLRGTLGRMVDGQTARLQNDLERDLQRMAAEGLDRGLVEARRRTLRANRLTAVLEESPRPADGPRPDPWAYPLDASARRRVVTD